MSRSSPVVGLAENLDSIAMSSEERISLRGDREDLDLSLLPLGVEVVLLDSEY